MTSPIRIGIAAHLLCQMKENLLNPQNTPRAISYGPIRKHGPAQPQNPCSLKPSLLKKFYPVGTTVRYCQKNYKIAQIFGKSTARISRNGESEIVPIAKLKPKLRVGGRVLILSSKSIPNNHTVARIESIGRGNVVAIREEFNQTEVSASIVQFNALARVIPIKAHSLEDLPSKQVSCKAKDGSTSQGTVYSLLKED